MIEDLLSKQAELMEHVPHIVRPDIAVKMGIAVDIISNLMNYLGSCGHKPWRPEPLSRDLRDKRLSKFVGSVTQLITHHTDEMAYVEPDTPQPLIYRQLISSLGIAEESMEYANSLMAVDDADSRREELVDILFFWLEQCLMSGFTEQEIIEEYHSKWNVNIKRYEDLEKGDTSWDHRVDGKL